MKKIFFTLFLTFVMLLSLVYFKANQYSQSKPLPFYDNCKKIWAHRGEHFNHPQNSLASFISAENMGASGIELDIHFDKNLEKFIVSHDQIENNKQHLTLDTVINKLNPNTYLWLDLKNLKNPSIDFKIGLDHLIQLLKNRTRFTIVESRSVLTLWYLSKNRIPTSFWIENHFNNQDFLNTLKVIFFKALIVIVNPAVLSFNVSNWSDLLNTYFNNSSFHLFTVNDKEKLKQLAAIKQVKVILTNLTSEYNLNLCAEN